MKNVSFKRLMSVILSVLMITGLMTFTAFAAEGAVVTVEQLENSEVSVGDTITLAVTIKNNPGFTNFEWIIKHTEALELVSVNSTFKANVEGVGEMEIPYLNGYYVSNTAYAENNGFVTFANAEANEEDGTLFTLTFKVLQEGEAPVSIESQLFNNSGAAVAIAEEAYVAGGIVVPAEPEPEPECEHSEQEYRFNDTEHWKICKACKKEIAGTRETHIYAADTHRCNCGRVDETAVAVDAAVAAIKAIENWGSVEEGTAAEDVKDHILDVIAEALAEAGVDTELAIDVILGEYTEPSAAADGKYAFTVSVNGTVIDETFELTVIDVTDDDDEKPEEKVSFLFPKLYNVKVNVGEGGKVNTSKTFLIAYGANRTIKITPDEGYEIASVVVNGKNVGAVEKYTIIAAVKEYTVDVTFAEVVEEVPAEESAEVPAETTEG